MLGEPEIDDRQEGHRRGDRLGNGEAHLDDLAGGRGGRRRNERPRGRLDECDQAPRQAGRANIGGPFPGTLEERWKGRDRPLELGEGRRQDDEGQSGDHRDEHAVDQQDRRTATDPQMAPEPGDERLQTRGQDHGDEHQDQDAERRQAEEDKADHDADADRETGPTDHGSAEAVIEDHDAVARVATGPRAARSLRRPPGARRPDRVADMEN